MEFTARRSSGRGRGLRLRLVAGVVAVAATASIGVGLTAAPADAARNNPCATARAIFRSYMNEARFWIGAADRLAEGGNGAMADQATAEANYYLGMADGALGDMSSAC